MVGELSVAAERESEGQGELYRAEISRAHGAARRAQQNTPEVAIVVRRGELPVLLEVVDQDIVRGCRVANEVVGEADDEALLAEVHASLIDLLEPGRNVIVTLAHLAAADSLGDQSMNLFEGRLRGPFILGVDGAENESDLQGNNE